MLQKELKQGACSSSPDKDGGPPQVEQGGTKVDGEQISPQEEGLRPHRHQRRGSAGGAASTWKEPLPCSGPRMVYGDGRMDVVKILIRMTCVVDIWQRTTIWIQKQTWVFKLLLAKAKNIAEVLGQTGWEGFCQQSLLTQYCFH